MFVKVHILKTWPRFFQRVWDGQKRAELRRFDRDFKVGDILDLCEWDPEKGEPTGRWARHPITDVVAESEFGLKDGYAMLSLGDCVAHYDPSWAEATP